MLDKIIEVKKQEILTLKKMISDKPLAPQSNGRFYEALRNTPCAIIAEIKKGSPSKGIIAENFDVEATAQQYQQGGAAALSVLTDEQFFYGHPDNIALARKTSSLPILRKDFIIDPFQIIQSQHLKADAILLIVAALSKQQLIDLYQMASELGFDVLVECHDANEVETALSLDCPIIGINNRNLKTFQTDLSTSSSLKNLIPNSKEVVAESGIYSAEHIKSLQAEGISSFLIGESLMGYEAKAEALTKLLG